MPIRRLSPLLINQIAAGEVIERPCSVVKELVENSLDAGAKRIRIEIEDGGRELIRVADDGCGIRADELLLAVAAHATSKISQPDDLHHIATLGFRGEALASIASVSRLRLASRLPEVEAGAVLEASGDHFSDVKPAGCAPGSVVEVRNLFFNTPARRKFMRGEQTEFSHIIDTVQRIAMVHADVGFTVLHNGRVSLDLPADQPTDRRCLMLLGEELAEALLDFESNERGIGLWGLAGQPSIARATAKHQYFFVNGRPVRDRQLSHAVKEAYRGLIDPARQPMIVLFVTLDPSMVDVNVHPAKAEVRFADANAVHGHVLAVVRQRLLGADLTPTVHVRDHDDLLASLSSGSAPQSVNPDAPAVEKFVEYFRQMDPHQKGFVYQQVREELGLTDSDNGSDSSALPPAPVPPPSVSILQVHNSYIVTQDEQGIVIIDQHALHERMMFQLLLDRISSTGSLESQRLITPAVVPATARQIDALQRLQPLLATIGIEADAMGPTTIAVHAFPSLLFDRNVQIEQFVRELLDRAEADDFNPSAEAALHEVLDMMSCKAAIKAGDRLAEEELAELLKRKDQIERAASCPHGRPTTVRLTLRDLEKHFHRT